MTGCSSIYPLKILIYYFLIFSNIFFHFEKLVNNKSTGYAKNLILRYVESLPHFLKENERYNTIIIQLKFVVCFFFVSSRINEFFFLKHWDFKNSLYASYFIFNENTKWLWAIKNGAGLRSVFWRKIETHSSI